jgi:hypothetical protein
MVHENVSAYISLNDNNLFKELYNGIGRISIYSAISSKALYLLKDNKKTANPFNRTSRRSGETNGLLPYFLS